MIDEHNIEQRLFEYHEGLMDASQKQELMEYLHQYPEYQRDFAIWAQARLHDEGMATPVFQQKLIKPTTWIPSAMLKWSAGIGVSAIVCLLFLFYSKSEISNREIIKTVEKKINIRATSEKSIVPKKANKQTFKKQKKMTISNCKDEFSKDSVLNIEIDLIKPIETQSLIESSMHIELRNIKDHIKYLGICDFRRITFLI